MYQKTSKTSKWEHIKMS